MTPTEQYGLVWVSSMPWEASISVCNKPKVSNSLSVWVSILDWSLSVKWAKQDAKNSWP